MTILVQSELARKPELLLQRQLAPNLTSEST